MSLGWKDIKKRALTFSKTYKDATNEFADSQTFLNDFFYVFGVDRKRVATFETKVTMGTRKNGYIDMLWKGIILVEMKSAGKSLEKAYTQAKDYAFRLEDEEMPDYIMVSDFKNIKLYRLSTNQEWSFKLADFHKKIKLFSALAGYQVATELPANKEVDIKAAEKMAKLHDVLKAHGYEGHELEVYLVRLLFCLFADDTGIFETNIFFDYISQSKKDGSDLSYRLAKLFEILDLPTEQRDKHTMLSDELKRFAYVNGSLFSEKLSFADFDTNMRKMLLDCASMDWSYISPAIFGSMFQGVMAKKERRELGAHYTSEENIQKLIKPLFLDELWTEFERIKGNSKQLKQFHEKISRMKFLDPACGCGNFLIVTYRELRLLELEILKMLINVNVRGQMTYDLEWYLKLNVNQFYGIEYEEFPCQIAQVGMWLIDHQMNMLAAEHFGLYYARLPLRQSATIVHGNALRINWQEVVPNHELSYILGNPPFAGNRDATEEQKYDMRKIFKGKPGRLDYVCAWYMLAAEYIQNTGIEVGFVSTNSIVQGIHLEKLWGVLLSSHNIVINFAYRSFKWTNEAKGKAAVHCVTIGFSQINKPVKYIFDTNEYTYAITTNKVKYISPTLTEDKAETVRSSPTPLGGAPEMVYGNIPRDGGHYMFNEDQKDEFLSKEPGASKYIFPIIGSREYINNKKRYFLFLKGITPEELKNMPLVRERVLKVKNFRLSSKAPSIRKFADTPTELAQLTQPIWEPFIVVPILSSGKRKYIPMGFIDDKVLTNNQVQIIPFGTLYHFGILTSSIHMLWVNALTGRLKSDFRYSQTMVYNTFPWPTPSEPQKLAIEKAAAGVLDARSLYPTSSLNNLYNQLTMPHELTHAHSELDRAVMRAYGYKSSMAEEEIVADLFKRYVKLGEGKV
jgi:hypothetical protein